eukprot:9046893-Alexandrium_andersonii.AAC.1
MTQLRTATHTAGLTPWSGRSHSEHAGIPKPNSPTPRQQRSPVPDTKMSPQSVPGVPPTSNLGGS